MNGAHKRPFVVSIGGQRTSNTISSNRDGGTPRLSHVAKAPLRPRASTSGGRRVSAFSISADPGRSRVSRELVVAVGGVVATGSVGSAPQNVVGAGHRQGSGLQADDVNDAVTNTLSKKASKNSNPNDRRPTMTSTLRQQNQQQMSEQQQQQQQRESQQKEQKPAVDNSSIQAERQQRQNRGLNLGLVGTFFGAREKTAQDLFRGAAILPGHPLCSDEDSIETCGNDFWKNSSSNEQDFLLSRPVSKVDCPTEFTRVKAAELKETLEDIAKEKREMKMKSSSFSHFDEMLMKAPPEPLDFWIDKLCVSPDVLERRMVIERHLDYFLANSDNFLVLLSSCYFQRLWCVYEWGSFVSAQGTNTLHRIRVCLLWLCSSATFQIPLVARDILVLSVTESLKCSELNDKRFLRATIEEKFRSVQAFETMVQVSALCALSMSYAVLALDICTAGFEDLDEAWRVFDQHLRWRHAKFLLPWRSVADKLGLPGVCSGLDNFWDQMQRSTKMSTEGGALEEGSELFCVSAPSRSRLRAFANAAAQAHLAILVRKARAAAAAPEASEGH